MNVELCLSLISSCSLNDTSGAILQIFCKKQPLEIETLKTPKP
ncbi:hypothetical protein MHA_2289 [Mannheimia haemolytica PHL213]|nr:hypothetical protein MHA_2289 [Mannheimia haemolytica PHL213]